MERLTASYRALLGGLLGLSLLGACSDDLVAPAPASLGGAAGSETSGNAGITSGGDAASGTAGGGGSAGAPASAGTPNGGSSGGTPTGEPGWPHHPDDPRTESVPGGTVQLGWAQLDIGKAANYDGGDGPGVCPDPDEMVTPGSVDFQNGVWTLTGSGEGFIHGWDQGNLVYFKTKISGDFTFTMKVDAFEMLSGVSWQPIEHNDSNAQHPEWYPFRLSALAAERYVGLVCSARNDRNCAPLTQLPGKTVSCRDPQSEHLKGAARCVFSHVTLTQP